MSALTFLLFKLNTLQTKIVKLWVSRSHGVMTVVYRIYTTAITPRKWRQGGCCVITQCHMVQINQSENRNSYSVWKLNNNIFAFDKGERLHSAVWLREFWTIHRHGFSPPEEFLRGEIIQGNFYRPCAQPRSQALSSLPPVRGCHCVVSSRNPVFHVCLASWSAFLSCLTFSSRLSCLHVELWTLHPYLFYMFTITNTIA